MPPQKKIGLYWGNESISFVEVAGENPIKVAQGIFSSVSPLLPAVAIQSNSG